jgi:hypothetical protein
MDDGFEIPGLNEQWTFLGAKGMEWMIGFTCGLLWLGMGHGKISRQMPVFIMMLFGMTMFAKTLREKFPDEERGVRNQFCLWFGLNPPGIPAPAELQPVWSGAPLRELAHEKEYMTLGLDKVFPKPAEGEDDDS